MQSKANLCITNYGNPNEVEYMSRFKVDKVAKTRDRMEKLNLFNRDKTEFSSWLQHRNKRGYTIDHLLLFGATMDELVKLSDAENEGSVRSHIAHLQTEHRFPISINRDGR
jgi:hypothetical protein